MPSSKSEFAFYMARQPIYDRNMQLAGYELLYRRANQMSIAAITKEDELTSLANVLIEVGLDRLAGKTKAFVNVPQGLLRSEALRMLPPRRVVLEILEDTEWTPEVESSILELKDLGYELALDDYTFDPRHEPFLAHVSLVKVDILGVPEESLRMKVLRARRSNQVFLAEKVETLEQHRACMAIGFDLFQGYFFSKPKTIRGTGVRANQALSLSLLAKIQDPNTTMQELETLIVTNVALCHKVLRLVNCVANGLTKRVDSIRQALIFLGMAKIRTMASLAVITGMPGKPSELYRMAMIRAKFCETAARVAGYDSPEKHFTVGLFSVLDALTDMPMQEVIGELPLAPDVVEALTGESDQNQCASTLSCALRVEQGDWEEIHLKFRNLPAVAFPEAVEWAREQERSLAA